MLMSQQLTLMSVLQADLASRRTQFFRKYYSETE